MENKYFTPDIENLCVGYECEQLINQVWTKEIFAKDSYLLKNNDLLHWEHTCIINKNLRVLYLTKEQIEAENWQEIIAFDLQKASAFSKNDFELSYFFKEKLLKIIKKEKSKIITLYQGSCKCINEFRKIIKLLEL